MEAFFLPLFILGGLAFAGICIWWSIRSAKIRREAFVEVAESMGLTSSPEGDAELMSRFGSFKLFSQGRGRKMQNVVQGDSGEVKLAIFDYQYTTGSGKQKQTHSQSVVSLQSPHLTCPAFTMRPEGMFDKIGSVLGFQDIDFESHPTFSKMFVLKSPNEEMVRQYFSPRILEFFESKKGISVEAGQGAMFFYRASRRIKPDEIKDYLAQAYEVYGAMVDQKS